MIEILLLIGAFTLFIPKKKNTVKTEIKETPTKLTKGNLEKTEVVQLQTQSGLDVSVPTNSFALPPKEASLQLPQIFDSPVDSPVDSVQSESLILDSGIRAIKNLDLSFIK